MSAKHLWLVAIAALTASLIPHGPARAGSEVLMDTSGFISGTQSFVDTFYVGSAGTLTVTLSDTGWPAPIQGLDFFVTSANTVLAPVTGPGTDVIGVGPGTISVHWFGQASGPLQLGLFGIDLQFQPGAVPVPLPTSLLLLVSALAAMLFSRRERRSQIQAG